MPLTSNDVILASAGSRKTTYIVEKAVGLSKEKKILITTYTNENISIVEQCLTDKVGLIPSNIQVLSWYAFLLQDCIRPYQKSLVATRVESLNFQSIPNRYTPKSEADKYFLDSSSNIYKDRATSFVFDINESTSGLVINRLEKNYDYILIDEVQDMCGYDLEIIKLLFGSDINTLVVGDPRQTTFRTNLSPKNKKYYGSGLFTWFKELETKKMCSLEERNLSYRCNQEICDFADALYPDYETTQSQNTTVTGHDGIFTISREEVDEYYKKYCPTILRWDKRADTASLPAINIGVSKGSTFDRVLIFPTQKMKKYLNTKKVSDAGDVAKFYVAVTRAKYSVAFVV